MYIDMCARREGRVSGIAVACAAACGLLIGTVGCVSTQVNDLDGFDLIPMSRVVPYPTQAELGERGFEVLIVEGNSGDLETAVLEEPWSWASERLQQMAEQAGASVLPVEASTPRDESVDYVLAVGFDEYAESSSWKPPVKFLWESTDEVAFQPGTCTNRVEVDYHVDFIEVDGDAGVRESFRLRHAAEQKTKNVDQSCALDAAVESGMFEMAMLESLSCLRFPIDRLLAPRGHVVAHRNSPESGQDLYQISLGQRQGMEFGEEVEILREQHAARPSGEIWRSERVIARGVVTDQIDEESAWVALDRTRTQEAILEGDVIKPVLREGLLLSLSGPDCSKILEVR